ncbi:DNA replication/repair protein RecF [Paraferrimonas sedimenticola]|uniref:DNA replication and repair protein RecF n=1 Tax=Paraferrimonas sedimenticola TaxID=375674 RepID=A0AA37W267_9GAMM|nr:DNA replication/repair protein RecF [Paraferrimonas sedimenticola]GLP97675.1 DNA replication and repair protein RecF [Paraferrimonas sedimenticola]
MSLRQLSLHNFRNFDSARLALADGLNLIYGDNGSGKTSLLEALYFLGMGRSFRSHLSQRMIRNDTSQTTVFAEVRQGDTIHKVGIARDRAGETQIRIDGAKAAKLSEMAESLPIQVITPESFSLLFEGPKARRQFIDWGVFHSHPQFHAMWVASRRAIRQRNVLLKRRASAAELSIWDKELVRFGEQVSALRNAYVASLNDVLKGIINQFLPRLDVRVSFYQGWDKTKSLESVLSDSYQRDIELGYTVTGPHKADLRLKVGTLPAQDALSRGQLKLLVCALRIAQGRLLTQQTGKNSIYLVDDLPSELDKQHRRLLLSQLHETGAQLLVTAIEPQAIIDSLDAPPAKVFHVKRGLVEEVESTNER